MCLFPLSLIIGFPFFNGRTLCRACAFCIGMRDFAIKFYKSKAWQDTRAAYFSSVGGLCERCLTKGIYSPCDIVHHKTPLNQDNISDPNIALSFSNLEALCRKCHGEAHGTTKRYTIDKDGRVTIKDGPPC